MRTGTRVDYPSSTLRESCLVCQSRLRTRTLHNERASEQGCNHRQPNHWPVLISHKHVTAKLGHFPACGHQTEASAELRAATQTLCALPPCGPFFWFLLCLCVVLPPLCSRCILRDLGTNKHSRLVTIRTGGGV